MVFGSKNIILKDNTAAVFRNPEVADAKEMNDFLKTCFSETNFLMRYPEEWTQTEKSEAGFIESSNASKDSMMIVCVIDGQIAGNCTLMLHQGIKTRHRASVAIGILQKYWGIGIGSALFTEVISIAKAQGILQIELDYVEGNSRARSLYEKIGFVHTGEIPNAIRLKDGTMLKAFSMVKVL